MDIKVLDVYNTKLPKTSTEIMFKMVETVTSQPSFNTMVLILIISYHSHSATPAGHIGFYNPAQKLLGLKNSGLSLTQA